MLATLETSRMRKGLGRCDKGQIEGGYEAKQLHADGLVATSTQTLRLLQRRVLQKLAKALKECL